MLTSGRRLENLLDREGQPMSALTVFTLSDVRGRNLAANTIGNVLRGAMACYLLLDARGIDLDGRVTNDELQSLGDMEDPARLCRRPLSRLDTLPRSDSGATFRLMSQERNGCRRQPDAPYPDLPPAACERTSEQASLALAMASKLGHAIIFPAEAIDARIPHGSSRDTLYQHTGLLRLQPH